MIREWWGGLDAKDRRTAMGVAAVLGTLLSAVLIWAVAGAIAPTRGQMAALEAAALQGQAPVTAFRHNPVAYWKAKATPLEGQPLGRLLWLNALRPRDRGTIRAIFALDPAPPATLLAPLLQRASEKGDLYFPALALQHGMLKSGDAIKVAHRLRHYDRMPKQDRHDSVVDTVKEMGVVKGLLFAGLTRAFRAYKRPPALEISDPMRLEWRQLEAFHWFIYRPTEMSEHALKVLGEAGRPEFEATRIQRLALLESWKRGAEAGLAVIDAASATVTGLAEFREKFAQSQGLAPNVGMDLAELEAAVRALLHGPEEPKLGANQLLKGPDDNSWQEPRFEGIFSHERPGDESKVFRVEIIKDLNAFAAAEKPALTLPAIAPLTGPDGRKSLLGNALAFAAMAQLRDMPEPRLKDSGVQIAWQRSAVWDLDTPWDALRQDRFAALSAPAPQVKGSLSEAKGKVILSLQGQRPDGQAWTAQKAFSATALPSAVAWVAGQALASVTVKAPVVAKALRERPLLRSRAELERFAYLAAGGGPEQSLSDAWRELYQRTLSPLVLCQASFREGPKGAPRGELLDAAIAKEPWRWTLRQARGEAAADLGHSNRATRIYAGLLRQDPCSPSAIHGYFEAVKANMLTQQAHQMIQARRLDCPEQALLASLYLKSAVDQTWAIRGGGFSDTISPLERDRFKASAQEAIADGELIAQRFKGEPRAFEELVAVARFMDGAVGLTSGSAWFEQARQLEPERHEPFEEQANTMSPKWFGSVKLRMEFARRWAEVHPALLLHAYIENGGARPHPLEQDEAWEDIYKVYFRALAKKPCDSHAWSELIEWAIKYDRQEEALKKMEEFFAGPGAKAACKEPLMVEMLMHAAKIGGPRIRNDKEAGPFAEARYLAQPEVWGRLEGALQSLCKRYPDNAVWPSRWADLAERTKNDASLKKAVGLMRGRYEDKTWTRKRYDEVLLAAAKEGKP